MTIYASSWLRHSSIPPMEVVSRAEANDSFLDCIGMLALWHSLLKMAWVQHLACCVETKAWAVKGQFMMLVLQGA